MKSGQSTGTSARRLAATGNWNRRKDRKRKLRDVPAANLLLAEAMGLEASQETPPTPNPSPPLAMLAEGGEKSAIDRLEALVLKEIEAVEQGRDARLGRRPRADAADRRARTLSTLTQTLQTLQRLREGDAPGHESRVCDCMPEDMDAFREDLARRIDAFMESRPDDEETCGKAGAAD